MYDLTLNPPKIHLDPLHRRLSEAGARLSIGSVGDSCDNAMAESIIGLFKTELIRRKGPWRGLDAVELTTLEWVDWYNNRRLFEAIGGCAFSPRTDQPVR
jgi:transposase InsO family protein